MLRVYDFKREYMYEERKIFEIQQFSLQFSYKLVWHYILGEMGWTVRSVCSKSCSIPSNTHCIFTFKMSCTLKGNIWIRNEKYLRYCSFHYNSHTNWWQSILGKMVWTVTLVCSKSCSTPNSTRWIFTFTMSCTLKGNIPIVSIMLTTFLSPSFLRNEFTKCSRVLLK